MDRNFSQDTFLSRLDAALQDFNRADLSILCTKLLQIINSGQLQLDETFCKRVLGRLQRKQCFKHLRQISDALIQVGKASPGIRKIYAQALIDLGLLSAAIPFLEALVRDLERGSGNEFELAEARGLIGRAYKQSFVDYGGNTDEHSAGALRAAINAYHSVYESDRKAYIWQGINAAALMSQAEAKKISIDGTLNPGQRGREIAQAIESYVSDLWDHRRATMWDVGTAMEACVALDRTTDAALWMNRYVTEPLSDAFEIGSTLRQLEEIWNLDVDREPGATLLPMLRAELLQRQGGNITLKAEDLQAGSLEKAPDVKLEKILGSVRYHSYKFMLRSIKCARAVARIEHGAGQGYGTGFLVRGSDLHEKLGDDFLLITNAHVISDDPDVRDALEPEDATVTFQLLLEDDLGEEEYGISEVLWTSPPDQLDTSVLRLHNAPTAVAPFRIHPRLPVADGEQRVYIIGHPKGGSLSFSIQDNVLLDHDHQYLHYRAPTEGGSSGSPVFNSQWKLIGLHHAGGHEMPRLNDKEGTYEANEGIAIQSIIKKMSLELGL